MNGYAANASFDYIYDADLSANERREDAVKTETDSDFLLLGLILNSFTSILFSLQFRDASGNYFSSAPVLAANYAAKGPVPYTFQGQPRVFPPGSQIRIDIVELSGADNSVQLSFVGIKGFVTAPAFCGPAPLAERLVIR
jgi:hypothetical protein